MTEEIAIPIKVKKPIKRLETIKQQRLLSLISENLGKRGGDVKTMTEIMLIAGYKYSTANQQTRTLKGIKKKLEPIVEQMKKQRQEMIKRLDTTISKAGFRDLVSGIDVMTKNIELLSGGATESVKYGWHNYSDKAPE